MTRQLELPFEQRSESPLSQCHATLAAGPAVSFRVWPLASTSAAYVTRVWLPQFRRPCATVLTRHWLRHGQPPPGDFLDLTLSGSAIPRRNRGIVTGKPTAIASDRLCLFTLNALKNRQLLTDHITSSNAVRWTAEKAGIQRDSALNLACFAKSF